MHRVTKYKKHGMHFVNLHKRTRWIIACTTHTTDKHHSEREKKKKEAKLIAMPSFFHRAGRGMWRVELWGKVRVRKGYCKGWWGGGNSFTAGWPQGSTFSTGILSRKGVSRSMQQVWEELTGKHYGCNIGDTCTHRTHSKRNKHHK